jgi:hypothetical protein
VPLSLYLHEYSEVPVSRSSPILASVYDVPLAERKSAPLAELMERAARNATGTNAHRANSEAAAPAAETRRRNHIWELNTSLHCSIIGTCLTAAELRRLLIRLNVGGAEAAGDHDLHMLGVLLAARPKEGAKVLEKALDRRHRGALNRFAKAPDAPGLCALWEEAMHGGDIPGAYWALLTHPFSTNEMVRHAFGDVHMLSHLVGATNRADLTRLRRLEADNAALTDKLERQQRQLRDGFVARDATIRTLNDTIARAAIREAARVPHDAGEEVSAIKEAIAALDARLARESEHRARLEQRVAALAKARDDAERARRAAERERDALQTECGSLDAQIGALLAQDAAPVAVNLAGTAILYIGGRANQVPKLKALVERNGGQFLHHDGGLEHSAALLPGLVSRADISIFPVDCVSHDAVAVIKRVCRQAGKPYLPLRTSSLACFAAALTAAGQQSAEAAE